MQVEWQARVIKGEVRLPSAEEQRRWVKEEEEGRRRRGLTGRYLERCDSMVEYVRWVVLQMKDSDALYPYEYTIDDERRVRTRPRGDKGATVV